MRTHTQSKTRFGALLIAFGTIAIVIGTVELTGATQSERPVVMPPQDVSQSALGLSVVEPKGNNAEQVAVNRLQKRRIGSQATTPSAISFVPAVPYYSGAWDAYSVAVADVNNDGKPDVLVANYCIAMTNCITGLVGVLLGNGDGTFQAAVTYSSGGSRAVSRTELALLP